jgi:UDP-N-acetylmuramoylalanine--D-glutamate ligase
MKVAVAGYGVEGESNYRYWVSQGHEVTIADEKEVPDKPLPEGIPTILGEGTFEKLDGFDLVVRTASLPPRKISTDGKIWSATNEFLEKCPAPVIGITGTKGKGTTASFIASILEAADKKVHIVGNIGKPALDVLSEVSEQDIVVYEMSSFQLWDARRSPHVAVILMIERDHLDIHASYEEYVSAKGNIARWQRGSDTVVYLPSDTTSSRLAEQSPGTKVPYTKPPGAYIKDSSFWMGEQKICSTSTVVIPGKHNLDNACAAITAAWQFTRNPETISKGLADFTGLPHRLKLVREVGGVEYYDDSISTTPGSAIAALASFDKPKVLILGGSSKGADFSELAEVVSRADIRKVLLMGEEADRIAQALESASFYNFDVIGSDIDMDGIVKKAAGLAREDDVVILSPACASFGMFKNYKDRGEQFTEAVQGL